MFKVSHEQVCYIGLGSNLGDSQKYLNSALDMLTCVKNVNLLRVSGIFRTEPQGDANQPWFYNQVAEIACALSPHELLNELQQIENRLGRVRDEKRRFGPRCIDLDILLFGELAINDARLTVPHPRMRERAFALVPLAEIAADIKLPDGSTIAELVKNLDFTLTGDKIYQNL